MKLNIVLDDKDELGGYTNVNLVKAEGTEVGADNLNPVVDDGEAEEIRAIDVLGFFSTHHSESIVNHWIKKLAHGGRLVIGCPDMYEVCRAYVNGKLETDDANLLLHGQQVEWWQLRRVSFTVQQLVDYLESKNLKIIKKRVNNLYCIVEVQRQ